VRTCSVCGENKDLEAFGFRNKPAERHHRACKTCVAAYGRQHYRANRLAYVSRNNKRSRALTVALKEQVWRYVAGWPCVDCGETDPLVLDFDHVDPARKRQTIYRLVHQAYSWTSILAEIEKCEIRCANCHRRRTALQFGWPKLTYASDSSADQVSAAVGTATRRPRRPGPPRTRVVSLEALTPAMIAAGLRICPWCGLGKRVEQFYFRDRAAGKRQSTCAECFTAYRRDHYRLNRAAYIQRNSRILRVRGREWLKRLWEYLLEHPCFDCGESDPVVLDCDHVDRATKRESVGFLARSGYPWATVLVELAKCEIRCANCHRRRTALQFDWPKLRVKSP
jgi:hypothetical protein